MNISKRGDSGFTLVELLVVAAIFSLAMVGIFSIYLSTQGSANTQEQVVDLQQNLRVAMENISRDLRWAGFLIPSDETAIETANANDIEINTISGNRRVAQIATGFTSPSSTTTPADISLKETLNLNNGAGSEFVRILRPADASQPVPRILTVTAGWSGTTLTVDGFNSAQVFNEGDIVAEYIDDDNNPATFPAGMDVTSPNIIRYSLDTTTNELLRDSGNGDVPLANNIATLVFSYLLDDGTEHADSSTIGDMGEIRAVRITLEGSTLTAKGTKNRGMTSLVALRNRN